MYWWMAPLAIDTTSCLGFDSALPQVPLPFSLLLWLISLFSFWPSFCSASSLLTSLLSFPDSLACLLVTAQADRSSGEASSTSSHVVTRKVAFRAGSLITDSHDLMGCYKMASEFGFFSSTVRYLYSRILSILTIGNSLDGS